MYLYNCRNIMLRKQVVNKDDTPGNKSYQRLHWYTIRLTTFTRVQYRVSSSAIIHILIFGTRITCVTRTGSNPTWIFWKARWSRWNYRAPVNHIVPWIYFVCLLGKSTTHISKFYFLNYLMSNRSFTKI